MTKRIKTGKFVMGDEIVHRSDPRITGTINSSLYLNQHDRWGYDVKWFDTDRAMSHTQEFIETYYAVG